ncbi:single-stranded DNA-binding protein [Microbacterium sp. W4I20]|uniref:single-stranded DNA-binding protein n=1 Tax=Microbacterium sp. W4I20 TaxID=3042262 RepID=UPI00277E7309|nr:single-stranded DNA-binding protein [Microbacterium sp. W4I20]MDQ0725550.1 single-strand DNA-binding protein [Microbacterium sp. W4I20]
MIDTVTIVGRVATEPTQGQTGSGPVTNFRMASSHRRYDNTTQTWVDGDTNWFSVAAFRQLGEHAKASLRTGDSIIVTGRLRIRSWESNGKQGTSVDIDADAIGHDLRWGTTAYRPRARSASSESGARTAAGAESEASEVPGDEDEADSPEGTDMSDLDLAWAETTADPAPARGY